MVRQEELEHQVRWEPQERLEILANFQHPAKNEHLASLARRGRVAHRLEERLGLMERLANHQLLEERVHWEDLERLGGLVEQLLVLLGQQEH